MIGALAGIGMVMGSFAAERERRSEPPIEVVLGADDGLPGILRSGREYVATMLVDAQWREVAPALARGLEDHYAVPAEALACFGILEKLPGHRASEIPALLREIARSAYHQKVVDHALRETLTLWDYLWVGWAHAKDLIRLEEDGLVAQEGA